MFAELDDDEMTWVADLATEFDVPAGFVLLERGQPASGMLIITDGTVTVELPHGPVEIGPGEFIGELPLLADEIIAASRARGRRQGSRDQPHGVLGASSVSRAWP
jgi:CRP-like cAMP-binding protein